MKRWVVALAGLVLAGSASAQEPRFCPNRPSLGSSACTTEPGHVQGEVSLLDWQRDDSPDGREDQIVSADLLARIGVGDVRLAVRQNLRNLDGKGLSFGVEPFVTLPVGRTPIGDQSWSAGAVLPVSYDLSDAVALNFTGQIAAQSDMERRGRHLDYLGIVGLGIEVTEGVTLTSEIQLERDEDPAGAESRAFAAQSIAWHPTKRTQLDLLAVAGLNRTSPDLRIAAGGAFVF